MGEPFLQWRLDEKIVRTWTGLLDILRRVDWEISIAGPDTFVAIDCFFLHFFKTQFFTPQMLVYVFAEEYVIHAVMTNLVLLSRYVDRMF